MQLKLTTVIFYVPGVHVHEWDAPSVQWDDREQSASHCCRSPWWSNQCNIGQQPGIQQSTELGGVLDQRHPCINTVQTTITANTQSLEKTLMTYLNGCGSAGEGYKSASSFVLNSWAGGLQQVVDATDETGALWRVGVANLTDKNSDVKIPSVHMHVETKITLN